MRKFIAKETLLKIVDRHNAGESISKICIELGLKQPSVSKAMRRNGLTLTPKKEAISKKTLDKAKRLYEQGKSQQQVAELLGIKRSTLAPKLRAAHFTMRTRSEALQIKLQDEVIREAYEEYLLTRETGKIAKRLNISKQTLLENFRRLDLNVPKWVKFDDNFVNKINEEINQFTTLNDLASKYSFSISGFRQAARRLNISIKKFPTPSKKKKYSHLKKKKISIPQSVSDQILRLYLEAKSIEEIEEETLITKSDIIRCLQSNDIKISPQTNITDIQIRKIYERRVNEKIGIPTLAKTIGLNPSSLYERFSKLGLQVDRKMGTSRLLYTDEFVKKLYEEARNLNVSVAELVRQKGDNLNFGSIMNIGRKLGLKPLPAAKLTGHEERKSRLYLLRIKFGNNLGIYAGSSLDPKKRSKEHLTSAKNAKSKNKRDKFIRAAYDQAKENNLKEEQWFFLEILPKQYSKNKIAKAETNLIKAIEKKYEGEPNIELLNGLVGAPIGGYGRKLDSTIEAEIIKLYSSGKNTTLIAKKIGVGRSTINRVIQRTGNQKNRTEYLSKYSPELKEQMFSLHLKGLSGKQISEELGVNRNTVSSIIRKLKQNENS